MREGHNKSKATLEGRNAMKMAGNDSWFDMPPSDRLASCPPSLTPGTKTAQTTTTMTTTTTREGILLMP